MLSLALHAAENGLYGLAINSTPESCGETPLMLAVYSKHREIVRILLQSKQVDVDAQDNMGWTALI